MGDGSMTTLTIADPEKPGIADYLLNDLPSRYLMLLFVSTILPNSYAGILKGAKAERGLDLIFKTEWRWQIKF